MQGNLNEIDIRSILHLIELGQRTGELFVEAYSPPSEKSGSSGKFWFVFFLNGQIVYAANTEGSLSRLSDYLRRYKLENTLNRLTSPAIAALSAPEYGYLWALLEKHTLTPAQGRSIIHGMVGETLFDLLGLHQGSFVFELGAPLSPQLTTLEVTPLLARTMKQVQLWMQLQPYISSPDQCPIIANVDALQEQLSDRTFGKLSKFADGNTSLRQIGRYLSRDILTVGRAIYPYVQTGVIQFSQPVSANSGGADNETRLGVVKRSQGEGRSQTKLSQPLSQSKARHPKVVCIDDGVTVRETVISIMEKHGYDVRAIANPLDAFNVVFHFRPHIILCDIAMPELDGYEVCAMLRKSTAFRQTPIVMLTGKDGFIDRVRAKMVGATDYLTKPFGESELLMLVEKYVGSGYPERHQPIKSLVNELEESLEIGRTNVTSSSSTPLN
jgi:twitching motility two-component system response regulator PilG